MRYELCEVCDFDEYRIEALIVKDSFENFTDAYTQYQNLIKTTPCCIIINKNEGEK